MPAVPRSELLREKVRALPDGPGVYLMKDRLGRIIYVGKAKSLKKRVSTYFQTGRERALRHQPKIRTLIEMIADFEILEVKSEPEALLLEGKLIKQWRPKYNTDFTDDKRFLLVRIDLEAELPRFVLTRFKKDTRSRYFGPFAHSGLLRKTLATMRAKFGVLLNDTLPKKMPDGRWQLYDDARAEIYGWPNTVTAAEYRERAEAACAFLDGKSREWLAALRAEMQARSAKQEFEKAAELRDVVLALERTLAKTRKFTRDLTQLQPNRAALKELQGSLGLSAPPAHMECFDISHISGTFVVASMVHFTDGRPDKDHYRRFSIKSFIGNDDFKAMEEVVARRYHRLIAERKEFPDLVVIDGGKGQVAAALKAFVGLECMPPPIIGLAKKLETIIFPDDRAPLNLPLGNPGLGLLQRLRDEAHRFANTYNADLQSRKIRESVLDDFPGLGPKRKLALLAHFGSLDKLRAASVEKIGAVPGFGEKAAARLHAFFANTKPAAPS
ncbi:MAG: excinuclease ABC subunit UvrC [bacterium]|nr:excinuclease ABC subunit UvrC [bacterium]MDI1337060.1 excinuclease ABC subunit UvrC [Lacunisphaera sp.]